MITFVDTVLLKQKCDSILNAIISKKQFRSVTNTSTETAQPDLPGTTITINPNKYQPDEEDDGGGGDDETMTDINSGKTIAPTSKNILFSDYQTFNGLFIYNNELQIIITDEPKENSDVVLYEQKTGGQGTSSSSYLITVPVKTQKIIFPSTLLFAGYPVNIINDLYEEQKQKNLSNEYGNAKLGMIDDISLDIYKKNNAPISVLGFDLSRKWFPIALFIVITIISFIVYNNVKKAKCTSTLIISGNENDDVLHFLITNKFIRFILWVAASPLIFILVLNSSPIHYNTVIYSGLMICCGLSVVPGIISYITSLKL